MQTILSKLPSWVWRNLISLIALVFAIISFCKSTSVQHSTHFADYNRLAWEEYNSFRDEYKKLSIEIPVQATWLIDSLADTTNFINRVGMLNAEWETSVIRLINETASKIHGYRLVIGQKERLDAIKPLDQEIHSLRPPSTKAKEWVYQRMRGGNDKTLWRPPTGTRMVAIQLLEQVEPPIEEHWRIYNPILALPRCVWRPQKPDLLDYKLDSLTTQSNVNVLKAWYSSMQK